MTPQPPPHDISLTWQEIILLVFAGICAIGAVTGFYIWIT